MNQNLEVAVLNKSVLGEGSFWDFKNKLLYWVDIIKGQVHIHDPKSQFNKVIQTDLLIGTVVTDTNGDLIIATNKGFFRLNPHTEKKVFINHPEAHIYGNRFNDGKCDPAGRFWAGTMSLSGKRNQGSLYCLDTDRIIKLKETGVSISNGIVWSLDATKMYYIDTSISCVFVYDYEKSTGNIYNRRVAFKIPQPEGWPDGMTIDADGMLWTALWGGSQVARWNPATGQKLYSIKVPVSQVSSVAFGGDNLTDIYITTASENLSEEQLKSEPLAGSLFCLRNSGFKGVKMQSYRG